MTIHNPYAKRAAAAAVAATGKENDATQVNTQVNMGPQSQRRLSLKERTHQMQSQSNRKKQKVTGQQTLFGDLAFDPFKDCEVCKAKRYGRVVHRAHHDLCNNRRGGAKTSPQAMALAQEEKRLKLLFDTPLQESEKCSAQCTTKEAVQAYFEPRECPVAETKIGPSATASEPMTMEATSVTSMNTAVTAAGICNAVTALVNDPRNTKSGRAPAAITAFAKVVMETIVNKQKDLSSHFDGLTITVPANQQSKDPQCHSTVGRKLLYVNWKRMHGLDVTCPRCKQGHMTYERNKFSHNKVLFPIFMLEGTPQWAIVANMTCPCCQSKIASNSGETLCDLPAHIRLAYPVETKYALGNKNCHIGKSATTMMDLLMPTYGNGDLVSRLLYNAINRSYIERVEAYYSKYKNTTSVTDGELQPYIQKDGGYITAYPPLGDSIRNACDEASSNQFTPWKLSDHDRHIREIQSVRCGLIFAQDHAHEVVKNYHQKKQLGAVALWDVSTETGEIASAVLVPSTKTIHFAHAAAALTRRDGFSPGTMCSDTWPVKTDFWELLFDSKLVGRLGLFHYIQRLTRTIKKNHTDHSLAISALLNCIYQWHPPDYEALIIALKEGTLSTKYSEDEIREMRSTKAFRKRYGSYLRKEIRHPHIMGSMLDDWFDRFKCSSSTEYSRPAGGRRDPFTGETLFTAETKEAVRLGKVNAKCLQDPLPLKDMYHVVEPNPNSTHQLKEHISRRGESNLESCHGSLAHFGNTGMRTTLVDNLNLTGTARHNLSIRQKLRLMALTQGSRKKIPAAYESVVAFFNHSEIVHVNRVAAAAGMPTHKLPFQNIETLPPDNGERFFSEYVVWLNNTKTQYYPQSRCLCGVCYPLPMTTGRPQQHQKQTQPTHVATTTATTTTTTMATPVVPPPIDPNKPTATAHPLINSAPAGVHQSANAHPTQQVAMPQTHQQHQQQVLIQPHLHQRGVRVPHPMMMGYTQQLFNPYMPWIAANHITTPAPSMFCCGRYRHWHNTPSRRGRPPHDDHCLDQRRRNGCRMGSSEKNGHDNPSCGAI